MTSPKNARTAALEALIDAHAVELKLPTVRRRFGQMAEEVVREQQTPFAFVIVQTVQPRTPAPGFSGLCDGRW
jgi:hypothetical protein